MIAEINKAWNWKGFNATEIVRTNDFGNVIFKTDKNEYWRICPEEISCKKIAESESEFNKISSDSEFIEDWEMTNLVNIAKSELGELKENEKYCLKMSAVIGGEYEKSNLGKISFVELIAFSGDLGFQIKDLKDGQKIKLNIKE
ncbi:T6SS immunity protein Tdi1 domain-containing protein [Winogradskyella ursingii]|uniref:T6SS immunity protein Tdi1 domain-containing protein n=1 Tax=Winogradskyella ursingii TaxID=2686079 RepID=UPI0015CCF35A|nr:T6SS immunity protein Tdi1 domain-containing protein [Winogradskyella ursingii]